MSLAASAAAQALIADLRRRHGDLIFYLSHGCCDGSTPMCLPVAELTPGAGDVRLGLLPDGLDGTPFWASRLQDEYLAHLHLRLDVAPGNNGAFSLEDGSGQRFVLRMGLDAAPPQP